MSLRELWQRLRRGRAGARFAAVERAYADGPRRHRPLRLLFGLLLLVVGLLASIPPGVPGFLLWVPGLALIASCSRRVARALDRAELALLRSRRRWRARRRSRRRVR